MAPKDLDELARLASECVACDLHRTRSSVVFGSGAAPASLMFIGEALGDIGARSRIDELRGRVSELTARFDVP